MGDPPAPAAELRHQAPVADRGNRARNPDPIIALDALDALYDVGLVRRRGRYVVITRAALRFFRLITWP
jgi:hypothetical protein